MKIILWIYTIVGNLYFLLYISGAEIVEKYAVGPLWLLMIVAPIILLVLVTLFVARRIGLF